MRRVLVLTCFLVVLAGLQPASAVGPATVAIVWPPNPTAEVSEALTRLTGELLSVGLKVTKCARPANRGQAGAGSRDWLDEVANERGASAIIDIVGDDALLAVDVWVLKNEPGRFEVTRVVVEPNSANPSERIALRAIDALRGTLLELDWASRERPSVPEEKPVPPPPPVVAASVPAIPRFNLEAGALMLASLDRVGPAFMPLVRVGWTARPWLVLQTSLAGLGSRPWVETSSGQSRVAQQFAVVGAAVRWRADKILWPFVALSLGALHTSLAGQSGVSTQGHDLDQWSLLTDASLGAGLRLSPRTFVSLAAHGQVAQPYVAVHIVDAVAATSGRPNLLLTLTMGVRL